MKCSIRLGCSSWWFCANSFEPLQGRYHFFSKVLTTGWLREAAMTEVTERAYDFLNLGQCPRILFFYFSDL
jgi:hypothetical protein